MIDSSFEGVRYFVVYGAKVFANLRSGTAPSSISVLSRNEEVPFEFCHEMKRKRAFLEEKHCTNPSIESNSGDEVVGPRYVLVNWLADWHVPGADTVQIEFDLSGAPFKLRFRNRIVVDSSMGRPVFRARLASHRARADLVLSGQSPSTSVRWERRVQFERSFTGGTCADNFQDVAIPLTESSGEGPFEVEVSIDYFGPIALDLQLPPYLFFFDCHVVDEETLPFGASLSQSSDELEGGGWACAELAAEPSKLDHLMVRCGEVVAALKTESVKLAENFFDIAYYRRQNEDVDFRTIDPLSHYLQVGWKEHRRPNPEFSVREYLLRHADIETSGIEPLIHYASIGQSERRSLGTFDEKVGEIWARSRREIPAVGPSVILQRAQDLMVPMSIIGARKLIVFVVPEHNSMSGGIYSMFSIADQIRRSRAKHGYDVLVMTRPNASGETYIRNSSFKNSETVLRFDQLQLFSEVSDLQIQIPEYATGSFVRSLSEQMIRYLVRRDQLHVNILNQNTRLMLEKEQFRDLRRLSDSIGQSVSHHAFFGPEFAERYDLPTLLLPAYTDLTPYPPIPFVDKEKIIIYSDDEAKYRRDVLEKIESLLPDYKLIKIREMTFDTYMDLATRCMFSVSFGEGFDGYVAQPMYQGGIGFALYTDEFFPDESYRNFENFFGSEQEMIAEIVPTIRRLENDRERYESLNRSLRAKWDELYSFDDYVSRIGKLVRKEYEIYP